MSFIDIFNFKKYFRKSSDSQVARYGHVNALYDDLDAKFTVSRDHYSVSTYHAEVSTYAGTIDFTYTIPSNSLVNLFINFPTSEILSSGIVLLNVHATDGSGVQLNINEYNINYAQLRVNAFNLDTVGTDVTSFQITYLILK
jgi:hypothetical protein